jgi:hypothetical protein
MAILHDLPSMGIKSSYKLLKNTIDIEMILHKLRFWQTAINTSGVNYYFYFVFNFGFFKSVIKYSFIKYFN